MPDYNCTCGAFPPWGSLTELEKIMHIVDLTKTVSAEMRAEVLRQLNIIGPTGEYPDGKMSLDDEGALKLAISNNERLVRIDFGKSIEWFALPKEQGIQFAILIMEHCGAHFERAQNPTEKP